MDFMNILVAFGVVAGVALILGVLLALISHFFAVPEDEKVKAVRACLPGVNCGACGYKGCDDYAAAVADGSAKPNLCVPGAEATAKELGEILGVEVEAPEGLCWSLDGEEAMGSAHTVIENLHSAVQIIVNTDTKKSR